MPMKAAGSVSPCSSGKSLRLDHIQNLSKARSQSCLPMFWRTPLTLSTAAAATSSAARQGSCRGISAAQADVASRERGTESGP